MLVEHDDKLLNTLKVSLECWSKTTKNTVTHKFKSKESLSLYRFGIFNINGYDYSISGWRFDTNVVTFENEKTGDKVKFSIIDNDVVKSTFVKDGYFKSKKNRIKLIISDYLRGISDALRV